ncbi:MAG: hypothetical protein M9962_00460 [Oligoflexia bacterium]|nr:hypothetical protein [Oligoflexia bacterium]
MKSKIVLFITILAIFQGCGNADKGISLKDQDRLGSQTHITISPSALSNFGSCKNFNVVSGSNPSYAQVFNSSSVCISLEDRKIVRIRVKADFPRDSMCIAPRSDTQVYSPTCIGIDGQADIVLSSADYKYLYFFSAADMNGMAQYISGSAAYPPPHAIIYTP